MNTKLSLLNLLLIAAMLLSACGPSSTTVTIQIPGLDGQQQQPPANNPQLLLVYILAGALVIIALAALLGKRGTQ